MSGITDQQLIDFVYAEARMLDEQRFEEWLDLLTEDAYYWMPLAHDQEDPLLHTSLLYEDKLLLRVRIERLAGQRTFSQQPRSRSHHLLARPEIETTHPWHNPEKGQYTVRVAFHYVESRLDQQALFAGWSTFQLVNADGKIRIREKRVDLVNCDAAMRSIQLLM